MKKALPVIVIAVMAVVLIYLFMGFGKMQESATPVNLNLPEKLQEFTRASSQTGQEALDAFQKEHAKQISWKLGARGDYTDGTVKLTVWTAAGVSDGHAGQMVANMASAIGLTHKVFSQPKATDLGAVKGYRTEGQGNSNFFYARGRQVYWIAVNGAPDPEALVRRVIPDLP